VGAESGDGGSVAGVVAQAVVIAGDPEDNFSIGIVPDGRLGLGIAIRPPPIWMAVPSSPAARTEPGCATVRATIAAAPPRAAARTARRDGDFVSGWRARSSRGPFSLYARRGSHAPLREHSGSLNDDGWSRRRESNPQPAVYKTAALPLSYVGLGADSSRRPIPIAGERPRRGATPRRSPRSANRPVRPSGS
jgi:hypothetical protein